MVNTEFYILTTTYINEIIEVSNKKRNQNTMKSITSRIIGIFFVLFMLTFMVTTGVLEEQKVQERLIKSTKLFADMDEIESIAYSRGSRVRKMIKQNGDWAWEDDTTYYIDQTEMKNKIDALLELTAVDKVEEIEDTENYGVDDPSYSIALTDINQNTKTVSVGKTTGERQFYVKIDDQKEIYIVDETIKEIIISIDSGRNLQDRLDAISSPTRR